MLSADAAIIHRPSFEKHFQSSASDIYNKGPTYEIIDGSSLISLKLPNNLLSLYINNSNNLIFAAYCN